MFWGEGAIAPDRRGQGPLHTTSGDVRWGQTRDRAFKVWSGCRDLNPGPSVPQTDTLTKLRHIPPRHHVASVTLACQTAAGSVSLAQPRSRQERRRAHGHAAPPRMRACRRNGKLRCAGHGADAVLVVHARAALTPKGRAVGSTGDAPLSLLRGQLPQREPDPADAD